MALGEDQSTPRAYATAFGLRSGTRGWFIISSCHWFSNHRLRITITKCPRFPTSLLLMVELCQKEHILTMFDFSSIRCEGTPKKLPRGIGEETKKIIGSEGAYDWKINGTRSWLILSECHWLTIIGELRSLWFIIILVIAPAQTFVELHFFYLSIFFVNAHLDVLQIELKLSGRIISTQKSKRRPSGTTLTGFPPWDKGTEVSHWFRRHFDSAKCRKTSKKMLKGGTALELADNRQKDETMGKLINHILKKDNIVLNEYYFQDVEKTKIDHYHFSEEYNIM